ncbi:MAG TPA: hypothetical protein VGO59_08300 [Verrucomicrobiae bacterium]
MLLPPAISSNVLQFQIMAQTNATYTVQYTTNLTPSVTWQTVETINGSAGGVLQINDSPPTNTSRFYRIGAQ